MKKLFPLVFLVFCLSCSAPEKPQVIVDFFDGEKVVPVQQDWDGVKRGNISYQLLLYSFADGDGDGIGDFSGLEDKLDYLDELGVSALWLSPIHPSSSYHGYDVKDYSAVNPEFGTEDDLKSFIDAAHQKGIKVYLDYVLNHTSKDCQWFIDAKKSENSPYRDFYVFSKNPASDIAACLIPQISSEGAAGYNASEWFSTGEETGAAGRMKFVLDWGDGSAPEVTVTLSEEELTSGDPDSGKFLYYGNEKSSAFSDSDGDGVYELVVDFDSDWGFLIRTSTTSWNAGEKYGASDNQSVITYGEPFLLKANSGSYDPSNVRFAVETLFHSNFCTDWFADLNYGSADQAETSSAFITMTEIADKWVRMGVDGFRLDAVKHIYHNSKSLENPTFLKKFYDRMNTTYKANGGVSDFYMVGEVLSEAADAAPYYRGLPALFDFSYWYRLKWAIQNGTGRYFVKDILGYQALYQAVRPDYIEAIKLSNHDEDRAGSELGKDIDKMKLAAAVLLTSGGQPYIYQGEELGYWGTKSNGDEYVRSPMKWDRTGSYYAPGALSGKIDSDMLTPSISVEAQTEDESSILNVYRDFARVRNIYPALAEGLMSSHPVYGSENANFNSIAAWYMTAGDGKMLVIHNFGENYQILSLEDDISRPVAVNGDAEIKIGGTSSQLYLDGYASIVFQL